MLERDYKQEATVHKNHVKKLNSRGTRLLVEFLALGAVTIPSWGPKIIDSANNIIEVSSISSNVDDYRIKTQAGDEICYSKDYPKLSEGLQVATIQDAYCPTVIDGQTRLLKISFPTKLINVTEIK